MKNIIQLKTKTGEEVYPVNNSNSVKVTGEYKNLTTKLAEIGASINSIDNNLLDLVSDVEEANENASSALSIANRIENEGRFVINGDMINNPDEEDITADIINLNSEGNVSQLKFKDRGNERGHKGYVILREGIPLSQQMTQENTTYEVRYNFDLKRGESVTVDNFNAIEISGSNLYVYNDSVIDCSLFPQDIPFNSVIKCDKDSTFLSVDNITSYTSIITLPSSKSYYIGKIVKVKKPSYNATISGKLLFNTTRTTNQQDIDGVSYSLTDGITVKEGDQITLGENQYLFDGNYTLLLSGSYTSYTMTSNGTIYIGIVGSGFGNEVRFSITCSRTKDFSTSLTHINSTYEYSDVIAVNDLLSEVVALLPSGYSDVSNNSFVLQIPSGYSILNSGGTSVISNNNFYTVSDYNLSFALGVEKSYAPASYEILDNITIPSGSTLKFEGGCFKNGSIKFQDTELTGDICFDNCYCKGTLYKNYLYSGWFKDIDDFFTNCRTISNVEYIEIKNGIYNVTQRLGLNRNNVYIQGNNSVINFTYSTIYPSFIAINTGDSHISTEVITFGNVSPGAEMIEVDGDISILSAGDLISIHDFYHHSFSNHRNYKQGEYLVVKNVEGNKVYLTTPVQGSYQHKNTIVKKWDGHVDNQATDTTYAHRLYKCNNSPVIIENICINGISPSYMEGFSTIAIDCNHVINSKFQNITINGSVVGLKVINGYQYDINNCKVTVQDQGTELSYGILTGNSQIFSINNCTCHGGNHGITTTTNYNSETTIINRNFTIDRCTCGSTVYSNGILMHGCEEYYIINQCVVESISLSGNHGKLINSTIYGNTAYNLVFPEIVGTDFLVQSNHIKNGIKISDFTRQYSTGEYPSNINDAVFDATYPLIFRDNDIILPYSTSAIDFIFDNYPYNKDIQVFFDNNRIEAPSSKITIKGRQLLFNFLNNTASNIYLSIECCKKLSVKNNEIKHTKKMVSNRDDLFVDLVYHSNYNVTTPFLIDISKNKLLLSASNSSDNYDFKMLTYNHIGNYPSYSSNVLILEDNYICKSVVGSVYFVYFPTTLAPFEYASIKNNYVVNMTDSTMYMVVAKLKATAASIVNNEGIKANIAKNDINVGTITESSEISNFGEGDYITKIPVTQPTTNSKQNKILRKSYSNDELPIAQFSNYDSGLTTYDSTYQKMVVYNYRKGNWVDLNGFTIANSQGTNIPKLLSTDVGFEFFDTDNSRPIWHINNGWVDSTGTQIYYDVEYNLTEIKNSNLVYVKGINETFTVTLEAATGYSLPSTIEITSGSTTLIQNVDYQYSSDTGIITIETNTTDKITITAEATQNE